MQTQTALFAPKQLTHETFFIEAYSTEKHQFCARWYKIPTSGKNKGLKKLIKAYYFATLQRRCEWMQDLYKSLLSQIDRIEERKAENKANRKADTLVKASDFYKVGDIIVNTWGYEQTNVFFYRVESVSNRTVSIVEICFEMVDGSLGHDCCNIIPVPGKLATDGDSFKLIVKQNGVLSNPTSFYFMRKWDGSPQYKSWGY